MFEITRNLVFSGAAFSEKTSFPLFPSMDHRLCLIYGKNGTGKSTISKAFLKISGVDLPEITDAFLEDFSGKAIAYPVDGQSGKVFVFNEEYIQSKVRLKEDGLGTIVMFGKQAELETLIEAAQKAYDDALAEREKAEAMVKPFNDRTSLVSPDYYLSKMNLALSGDQNWAGRERVIIGGRRNASVNNATYETIVRTKPEKNFEETKVEYQRQYDLLSAARSGNAKITTSANLRIVVPDNEDSARSLLAQCIEKPELSERETYLLSLLSKGKTQQIEKMQVIFENSETAVCPFCLQPVSEEYKNSLVQSIKKILSKIVEEHKAALLALKISPVVIDLSPFQKLEKKVLEKCEIALSALNMAIEEFNATLEAKIENPYSSIELKQLSISDKALALKTALEQLEAARIEYNKPLNNIPELQRKLQKLNASRAYYEIEEYYTTYLKQKEEKTKIESALSARISVEKEKKKVLDKLQAQRKSIKIAIDMINARLRYVFFATGRLEIESDDSGTVYTLKSNGASVKPSDISVGERNILALCYFFVEMLDNTEAEKAFSKEAFVVIDDPISSFDHENRIGIMSLLRRDLEKIVVGNSNSRIVLLTHDLQSAFDLQKAFDEIVKVVKNQTPGKCNSGIFELKNRMLSDFRYHKRHEYSELLADVYRFGVNASEDAETTIGNVMRRTLEAFSTFVYKKGIDEISISSEILGTIGNEQYSEYFRHLMYRLVLNGESHSEERIRSLTDDNDFLEMLSKAEKQRTARDIICFIYLLNPSHVRAHLGSSGLSDFENVIETWCKDILFFAEGV